MAENEIPVDIVVNTKDASKQLDAFERDASKSLSGVEKAFGALKIAAAAAVAVFAGKTLINGLSKAIDSAAEADAAVAKLNIALAATGEFTADASKELQEYAKRVQETTTVSDDAAIAALALAKNFGITNKQAQETVDAAIKLSAATGKDLNTAVEELGKTYSGTAGRLAKLRPEFRALTEEQIRQGGVVKAVNEIYKNAATGGIATYEGAVAQAANNFGDLFEEFGKVITRNAVVVAGINLATKVFIELAKAIEDNAVALSTVLSVALQGTIRAIVEVVDVASRLAFALSRFDFEALAIAIGVATAALAAFFAVQNIGSIIATANSLVFLTGILYSTAAAAVATAASATAAFLAAAAIPALIVTAVVAALAAIDQIVAKIFKTTSIVSRISDSFSKFFSDFSKGSDEAVDSTQDFGKATDKANKSITEQLKSLLKINPAAQIAGVAVANAGNKGRDAFALSAEQLEKVNKELDEFKTKNAQIVSETSNIGANQFQQIQNSLNLEIEKLDIKTAQLEKEGLLTDELRTQIELQRKNLKGKASAQKEKVGSVDLFSGDTIEKIIKAFGAETATYLESANKSAGEVLSAASGIAGIGSAITGAISLAQGLVDLIPQILQGLTKLFDSLTDLPNVILKGLKGLFKAIVNLVANLIPNIASAIEEILLAAIEFVAEKLPDALITLIKALPDIVVRLLDRLPDLVIKFVEGFIAAMPEIAVALVDALITKGGLFRIGFAILKAFYIELPIAVAKGVFKGLQSIGPALGKLFGENFKAQFDGIGVRFAEAIKRAISLIGPALGKILTFYFKQLPTFLLDAFKSIPQLLANGFSQLPDLIAGSFKGLGSQIASNLGGALDKLNPANILSKMFTFSSGGKGTIEKVLNIDVPFVKFAQGGFVPGSARAPGDSEVNDRIIALLSPGEAVIPRSITNNPKLKPYVDALLSGSPEKTLPGFFSVGGGGVSVSTGGISDAISGAVGGAGDLVKGGFEGLASGSTNVLAGISQGASRALEIAKEAGAKAFEELKKLNPQDLMEIAKRKAFEGIAKMFASSGSRLAEGGLIPTGFPNDTFPAKLTSGELVIPTEMVSQLGAFLDGASRPAASNNANDELVLALLTKIANIVSQPVSVQTTATVNNKAFADIILNLNRSNARLSA